MLKTTLQRLCWFIAKTIEAVEEAKGNSSVQASYTSFEVGLGKGSVCNFTVVLPLSESEEIIFLICSGLPSPPPTM